MPSIPLRRQSRTDTGSEDVTVITTAALPWRTGPAYLSIWHACGLAALGLRTRYHIPWLTPASQQRLLGRVQFQSPDEHAAWLAGEAERIGCPPLPQVSHYRGYYSTALRSIIPLHAVVDGLPPCRAIVLEEPEHLCWPPVTPPRHRIAAERVVGVVMTNYEDYVARSGWPAAGLLAKLVERYHRRLVRRHTDRALLISPAVAMEGLDHPVEEARITGVLAPYSQVPPVAPQTRGAYFLGSLVWDKGLDEVIALACRTGVTIDIFGGGPDAEAIAARARELQAPVRFLGPSASPWEQLADYRVFVNPSRIEVLCTATADALVAGRHAILPECPSNRPFLRYPNAHGYRDIAGAAEALQRALELPPEPPHAIRHDFDWMQACRNLAEHCGLGAEELDGTKGKSP